MYCGWNDLQMSLPGADEPGAVCQYMQDMKTLVEDHGGTVDHLFVDADGVHGMFKDSTADNLGAAVTQLFSYIEGF